MSVQLPLDLEAADRFSRERLIVTPALRDAVSVLEYPDVWLSPHLMLMGVEGTGKTHLAHIFADQTGAHFLTAQATHNLDLGALEPRAYVVDDAESASEEALFHLHNHAHKLGHPLLLTTRAQPLSWRISLPDLASRLHAMRLIVLPEPDEELLAGILHKLFTARAISPSVDMIDYLVRRMDRTVTAAQKTVTQLEQYANGRPFNRALARTFVESGQSTLFGNISDDQE